MTGGKITKLRDSLGKILTGIRGACRERWSVRFFGVFLILAAGFSAFSSSGLDHYKFAYVELSMNATVKTSARLFFDAGKGYQARHAVRVRIDRSKEPVDYLFRIPAGEIGGLLLDPSQKPGRFEIAAARILDSRGGVLQQLDPAGFQMVEGTDRISTVDGKFRVESTEQENSSTRILIGGKVDLRDLKKGLPFAIFLRVLALGVVSALIAWFSGTSHARKLRQAAVAMIDWVEGSRMRRGRAILIVLSWSLVLTLLVISAVVGIQNVFIQNHPYFYDPVSYTHRDIGLFLEIKDLPRLPSALKEWLTNDRYPLRTTPLILLHPSLLAHPLGHMATAAVAFFILIAVFCWTAFKRSGSLIFGLAAASLLAALPWHFDCHLGIGAYWLDTVSAYFLLLSAMAVLNWERGGGLWWIAAFAVFASCTVLSRYVSVAYVLMVCGPLLTFAIVRKLRSGHGIRQSLVLPAIISGLVIGVLAMPFLIMNLSSNVDYYSNYGYAIGSSPAAALAAVAKSLYNRFLGAAGLSVLLFTLVAQLFMLRRYSFLRISVESAGAVWVFLGMLVCQVFVVRTVEAIHQFGYLALLLAFTCLTPVSLTDTAGKWRRLWLALLLFGCAAAIGVNGVRHNHFIAENPSPDATELKSLDLGLADALYSEGSAVVWSAFFDEYGPMPAIEAFLKRGTLPGHPTSPTFSVHEKYFTAWYPGKSKEEICDLVLASVNSEVNIAVVVGEPDRIDSMFNNDYSRAVSRHLATKLPADNRWKEAFRIHTVRYGEIVGYRNLEVLPPHARGER